METIEQIIKKLGFVDFKWVPFTPQNVKTDEERDFLKELT
jgi:hypothetical protein